MGKAKIVPIGVYHSQIVGKGHTGGNGVAGGENMATVSHAVFNAADRLLLDRFRGGKTQDVAAVHIAKEGDALTEALQRSPSLALTARQLRL